MCGKELLRFHEARLQPAGFVGGTRADKPAGDFARAVGRLGRSWGNLHMQAMGSTLEIESPPGNV